MKYFTPKEEFKKIIQMENSKIYKNILLTVVALCCFAFDAMAQPTLSKTFSPSTIGPGSISTITFTITNGSGAPVTDLAFTDALPAAITIADPSSASTTCLEGVVSAPEGGGTVSLSGGRLGGGQTCFVTVNVTASTPGTHTNPAVTLSSSAGSSMSLSVDLTVSTSLAGFSKSFSPASVDMGEISTLTFTIDNTANAAAIPNLDFTDNLPAGMVIASPSNLTTDCGTAVLPPTLTGVAGSSQIILDANGLGSFPAVGAGATCTVTVDVVTTGAGKLDNVSENLQSNFVAAGKATADLNVTKGDPIHIQKSFTNDPAVPGGTVDLEFTIKNFDRDFTATGVAFSDDLDAALTGLAPSGALPTDPCGAGSMLSFAGGVLTLTGGTVPLSGGTCTFTVTCDVPAGATPGTYTNVTSTVSGMVGGTGVTGNDASAKLFLEFAPTFTKEFTDDPAAPGGTAELVFTITNTDPANDLTDIAFTDIFNTIIQTATVTPSNGDCGTESTFTFQPLIPGSSGSSAIPAKLTLSGGMIPMGGSCTFSITLNIEPGAPGGIYPNTTSILTGTVNGDDVEAVPATDDLVILTAPRITKTFAVDQTAPGTEVDLTFTLSLDAFATTDATDLAFTDDLDAFLTGTVVATPNNLVTDCSGTVAAGAGSSTISLINGTLTPGGSCSITVTVVAGASDGVFTNTTSDITATVDGQTVTGNPATDDLIVSGLVFTKEFIGDPALPGETISLKFTLDNTAGTDFFNIVQFTDNLGLTGGSNSPVLPDLAATGSPTTNTCGGTLTGTEKLTYSGGSVAAGASCTIEVDVLIPAVAPSGTYTNATSSLFGLIGGTTVLNLPPATAPLVIDNQLLGISKSFTNDPVLAGDVVDLEFTLTNLDATRTITDIQFTDNLDDMLTGAQAISAVSNGCGGMAASGFPASTFDYQGGTLAPGASCSITIKVQVPATVAGNIFTNTTGEITGKVGMANVVGGTATDDLQVRTLLLSKSFDGPVNAPGDAMLTFTLENLDAVNAVQDIDFMDDLDAMLSGTTVNQPIIADVSSCGPDAMISASGGMFVFQNAELEPGGSCSFSIKVLIPCSAPTGTYTNTTSSILASGVQGDIPAPPATTTLSVTGALAATFTRPADVTISCDESTDPSNTGDVTNETHSCCTGLNATFNDVSTKTSNGSCTDFSYTITRTWSLVDCNGVASPDQVQTITVVDNTIPTVVCPPDVTIECDGDTSPSGCFALDNGTGTINLPPVCPFGTPVNPFMIVDGLPPGTTIEIPIELVEMTLTGTSPGGSLGGEIHQFDAVMELNMMGTGALAGFNRTIQIPVSGEMHSAPRTPGDPVQSFDTDMFQLQGALFGDPDFDQLQITAGTGFGLPSPGHTTLTQLPGGDFNVDSFFDITYQIDFVGAPGGALDGLSGSNPGNSRIETGAGPGIAVGSDNCDPNPTITHSDASTQTTNGTCTDHAYTITRTWKATDACGNESATCDQIINVVDTTIPTVSCPPTATVQCDADSSPAATGSATGMDNCDSDPSETFLDDNNKTTNGTCTDHQYTITRTWKAIDACGNESATCDQIINVVDNTIPTVTCPAAITIECDKSTGTINTGEATGSDNCDANPTVSSTDASTQTSTGACTDNSYTITRTWTATDACGNNSATCDQIITVVDTKGPTVNCPANVLVECDGSTDPANTGSGTAVDNCDFSPTI